jgi:hypothetical protein
MGVKMRVGVIQRERAHAIVITEYSFGLTTTLELELGVVIDGAGARAPKVGPKQSVAPPRLSVFANSVIAARYGK